MIRRMPADCFSATQVTDFWREAGPERWLAKDDVFDARFRSHFLQAHEAAAAGGLAPWAESAEGALALLLLLDQFPRNAFRGSARMFATDTQARAVAGAAVDAGQDLQVETALRPFFYMPYMHSELLADQRRCVSLCESLDANTLRFARLHCEIIERFGRFPHRNALLGRASSAEELRFLNEGGFAG